MKKTYIAPEMEVMNIETVEMMATSVRIISEKEDEGGNEMLGNERRGSWGDLWGGEE